MEENGTKEVSSKAVTIIDYANSIVVKDGKDYVGAGELCVKIKGVMKQADESFNKIIKKAYETHKQAVAEKAKIYDPLKRAYVFVKGLMEKYDAAQEAIRQAEERRLREIARKAEEERRLQEAIEAEQNGETEISEAILEEPVYTPPIIIQKEIPKVAGISFREVWKFRIKNPDIIPKMYMLPDMVKIGGVVRSMKEQANIPGVEVYSERV